MLKEREGRGRPGNKENSKAIMYLQAALVKGENILEGGFLTPVS